MLELHGERHRRGGPLKRDPRRRREPRRADGAEDDAEEGPLFAGIGQVRARAPVHPARKFVLVAVVASVAVFAWQRLFPPTRYTVVEVDMNAAPDLRGADRPAAGERRVLGAEEGPPSSATPPPDRAGTPAAPQPLAASPSTAEGAMTPGAGRGQARP